jgi:hypothetical protein
MLDRPNLPGTARPQGGNENARFLNERGVLVFSGVQYFDPLEPAKVPLVVGIYPGYPVGQHGCYQVQVKDLLTGHLRMLAQKGQHAVNDVVMGIDFDNLFRLNVLLDFLSGLLGRPGIGYSPGIGHHSEEFHQHLGSDY